MRGNVSVTVYGSIVKLHRVARLIAPNRDFKWLAEIEADLRYQMRPRSRYGRVDEAREGIPVSSASRINIPRANDFPPLTMRGEIAVGSHADKRILTGPMQTCLINK
jgi:hypothetical protein